MPTYTINTLGQADFDLADALDDPDPTPKPISDEHLPPDAGLHPSPNPCQAQEGPGCKDPDVEAELPGLRLSSSSTPGAGDKHVIHGDLPGHFLTRSCRGTPHPFLGVFSPPFPVPPPPGSALARLVSPAVSVVVVALVGTAITYF
ncbi:glycoprotein Xg-like [Dipodomys spectabilis]|uniref:glycoprotein Xg-like n=1 Tax=Dipodomys spectabilis TaxID=105255 RepID=UPI001C53E4C6|nr:glycoprotein Xg-like [Dipodomys spectabilis]